MALKDIGGSVGNVLYRQIGRVSSYTQRKRSLRSDILENETSYLVVFDAPGAEAEELQVRYLDGTVNVQIDRFRQFHDGFRMRFPGRSMSLEGDAELPDDAIVEPDAGTARLTEVGTLNVEIPKDGTGEGAGEYSEDVAVSDSDGAAEDVPVDDAEGIEGGEPGADEITIDD
ncbi:Hsp20 family protein [Halostagnicola sp. A-GB9-2]|uniref:Hsp20 family protein n=1 Tax=Halostagnicola sp. A-GB9-2 TaxID=3048066 RepID=UPI0024C05589|nr:Hsp20 family protein [Halostagnicola sp. A-GB9-2]MDJ1431056.1 Hsp20 family protein [Halostagnicola sp. A-GB9-2]